MFTKQGGGYHGTFLINRRISNANTKLLCTMYNALEKHKTYHYTGLRILNTKKEDELKIPFGAAQKKTRESHSRSMCVCVCVNEISEGVLG